MKLKRLLSLAMLCIVGMTSAWAQTWQDVTSTYIQNANLSYSTGNPGNWTITNLTNKTNSNGKYAVEFYSTWKASSTRDGLNSEKTVGLSQQVTLPAGTYKLVVNAWYRDCEVYERNLAAYLFAGQNNCLITNLTARDRGLDAEQVAVDDYKTELVFKVNNNNTQINIGIDATFHYYLEWIVVGGFKLYKTDDAVSNYYCSDLIKNNSFEDVDLANWNKEGTAAVNERQGNKDFPALTGVYYAERWWDTGTFDLNQTLNDLPDGKYSIKAGARHETTDKKAYLYAGDKQTEVTNDAAIYEVKDVVVTNGSLKIGFKGEKTTQKWTAIDNFQLIWSALNVADLSETATSPITATADKWYAINVPIDGTYTLTPSAGNLYYTQDGDKLPTEVTESISSSTQLNLTQGKLYVKGDNNATITFAAFSKSYTVGTATSDMTYAQPGQTVTVTYADAVTNDGNATFAKNGNPSITIGGQAVAVTATANGFTFVVPDVVAGADYTLAIPANAFGYAAGNTYNEAQNITIKTPAIYDGTYYFYNPFVKKYMSRGGVWATSGIFDDWGLAVNFRTDADGMSTFQFFDNQRYLGEQGYMFGDIATPVKFKASVVEGGYEFQNMDGAQENPGFLAHWSGRIVDDGRKGDNLDGTSNVWTIETVEEHRANYTRNANNQAKVAAAAAGFSAQNAADLETEIAGYTSVDIKITGSKAEKFQQYAATQEALKENEYYKEIVENIPAGFYKLTVDAYQRAASNDVVAAAGGARGLIYLYANGAKTQLKSVMEYGATTAYNNNFAYNGLNYPNSESTGYTALETGNYKNIVYVYVPADAGKTTGTLTIGINNPVRQGNSLNTATWAIYNNWKLEFICKEATDYIADGVHHYIGDFENMAVETTDETPTVDLTLANISGTVTATATNTNGLVYAKAGQTISGISNNLVVDDKCANLVLTDGHAFKAHKNFTATNASYTMSAVAEKADGKTFGTLMIPFAASTMPDGNKIYVLDQGVNFGEEIHATEASLQANVPVLVTKAGTYSASVVDIAATNDTYTNGELVGTYKAMTAPANSYVLQKHDTRVAFFLVDAEGTPTKPTVNPFRAYIKEQQANNVKALNIFFDDEETSVESLTMDNGQQTTVYDLSGRKVSKAQKGVYIVNGKKVMK